MYSHSNRKKNLDFSAITECCCSKASRDVSSDIIELITFSFKTMTLLAEVRYPLEVSDETVFSGLSIKLRISSLIL